MPGKLRAANGKVAIYTGTDNAPFDDPVGNMGRVKFHSDLDYIRSVAVLTRTLSLPAIPKTGSGQSDPGLRVATYNLGSHGRSYTPFIVGIINVFGVPVAFTGSVLVHKASGAGVVDYFGRWLALGADATSIYVHEYSVQMGQKTTGVWDARPAQTFTLTLHITDEAL